MGFNTDGFVLRPPRTAPSNAVTTGEADNGVCRDHKPLPAAYDFAPDLPEVAADQYRAAVLQNPNAVGEEHLLWAANSSSLALLETPDWTIRADDPQATVSIPTGTLTVDDTTIPGDREDGTTRLIVRDTGGRGIAEVRYIAIARGDTGAVVEVGPDSPSGPSYDFASQDPDGGVVVLSTAALTDLGGGVSHDRGDVIFSVSYIVAAARFWWTRNDRSVTRFAWNGRTNRWEALKGNSPSELDILTEDSTYTLFPRPSRFQVGDNLPGNPADPDEFALVRVGIRPDATATVPLVEVIPDQEVADYTFPGATPDAIVGSTSGVLRFNPAFIDANAGQAVWYNAEQFPTDSNGAIGELLGADIEPLFLAPIPGPTDKPFVRLGFRRYLTTLAADNDSDLAALTVSEGEVGWSRTTGKLKLSQVDVDKSDPDAVGFDVQYLGNEVYYDGVALSTRSLQTRQPVQLVDDSGSPTVVGPSNDLFIPSADPTPAPSSGTIGLGISGTLLVPDGTGIIPNVSAVPTTRPNGSGLVREVAGFGDTILFAPSGAVEDIQVVEFDRDIPKFAFNISRGEGYIARELLAGKPGSRAAIGRKDRNTFSGEALYFLQADVEPAFYAEKARLYSREQGPFTLEGTEKLYFAVDGTTYTWDASGLGAGTFTAVQVAADIDALITGGQAFAQRDHVVIEAADPDSGTLEIGFGSSVSIEDRDFSGAALLGFLPGWRVDDPSSNANWLPDQGSSLGVFRSPQNKDRSNTTPDVKSRDTFENEVFAENIIGTPTFPITNPPLQDVAGFDENVFFEVVDGLAVRALSNLSDVLYDFGNDQFFWLERGVSSTPRVEMATTAIALGNSNVVGATLHPAVGAGNGLYVAADGSTFVLQQESVDYLLPADGGQGVALLVESVGAQVDAGAAGEFNQGTTTFEDQNATFLTDGVTAGYRLRIVGGDAAGSYIVASVTSETELEVEAAVPFLASAGPTYGEPYASWKLHRGFPTTVYDAGVVADVQYTQFNHLSEEPFQIRLLDGLGTVPTPATQPTNRLVAVITDAVQRGRQISIRFGLDYGNDEASLTALERGTELGVMANNALFVPDVANPHFTNQSFSIRVGSKTYTIGADLTVVAAFTDPLLGDQVEVLDSTGELKFGEDTLVDLDGSVVTYDEQFLPSLILAAGAAEFDVASGEINLSDADMTGHVGVTAYFVEQLITVDRLDVVTSPIVGAFYINTPLRAGQLVEAEYWQADSQGNQIGDPIIEFLPLIVRLEEATRIDARNYSVNPSGKTVAAMIESQIWVGANLQNFGNTTTATFENNIIAFTEDVDPAETVQINYGVYEAFGGEQAYNTSTVPVWRPPFFLEQEQDTFTLETDRTGDLVPGMLLRLGATPFYIKSSTYDAGDNETTVVVWPTPQQEAGSRAPGNDVLSLLSSIPVTTEVDGIPTGGSPGFLPPLVLDYEPVDKGMLSITFTGDVTSFAVAGHLLEIGGYPFIIVDANLSDDGRTTKVDVSSPSPIGLNSITDTAKISVRPVYQPEPRNFLGIAPLVESEDFELVLFGEIDDQGTALPGRTLFRGIHFEMDPNSGAIELLDPVQDALAPGQKLLFSYTRLRSLSPFPRDNALIYPRYKAQYAYVSAPSAENGLAGTTLLATYTFRSPDSFYYRTVTLEEYMSEVAEIAVQRVQAQNPSGGASVAFFPSANNQDQGNLGLKSERRDLTDQDRAARTFIDFYNTAIVAFEQILETMDGGIIGDRDGKFRFFIGRDKIYAPPGYEDEVTGDLNARLVWGEVFLAANGSFRATEDDIIVNPETATQTADLEVAGNPMDPFLLRFYIDEQGPFIANDMDDRVLSGLGKPELLTAFPFPIFRLTGKFNSMWEPHRLSRLFPEAALVFTTTFPGMDADLVTGDPGVYAFFRILNPPTLQNQKDPNVQIAGSTFAKPIGVLSNPAKGVVDNVTDAQPRERLPRARIWAYFPDGSADLDATLGLATPTSGYATVVATPLFIREFPIDPDTGLPDTTRLISQGGDLADLESGDSELSTPAFLPVDPAEDFAQQIGFGKPTGEVYQIGNGSKIISKAFGNTIRPAYGGVFIGSVEAGCVIILSDEGGNFLTGNDVLRLTSQHATGDPVSLEQGDTIYGTPPTGKDAGSMSNPPTVEEMTAFAKGQFGYRRGFDVAVQKRGGNFLDLSAPSKEDPLFPIKEILGQNPPQPLSTIEADIEFVNNDRDPFNFPALQGETTNDDGDYGIPYLGTQNTEIDRLKDAFAAMRVVLSLDGPAPTATQLWLSIYPDEIVGNNGLIVSPWDGTNPPATVVTTRDLTPVGAGPYLPNSGIGDARPFDLLMVEVPNTTSGLAAGATGILSIGDNTSSHLEVPRFVTPTFETDTIKYTVNNAMAHVSTSFATGMVVTRVGNTTTFDISSMGALFFNDAQGGTAGGLNRIFAGAANQIIIRLYENGGGGTPGALVEEIVFSSTEASGGASGGNAVTAISAGDKDIQVDTAVAFVTNTGTTYDFTVTIDTFVEGTTDALITSLGGTSPGVGGGTGSVSSWVSNDRLTFNERVDLSTAPERGTTNAGATVIEAGLSVWRVTANASLTSVNAPGEVNNNLAFTFLSRDGSGNIGTFVAASGTELGTIKVMAWEDPGNLSLTASDIVFSAIPSSEIDSSGVICKGTGTSPDGTNRVEILNSAVSSGQVSRTEAGDILVVSGSAIGNAAVKAGTYLVRHAIEENVSSAAAAREEFLNGVAGAGGAWAEILFPTIVTWDDSGPLTVEVTDTSGPGPGSSAWTATGRLYAVVDSSDPTSVVSMAYSALAANVFTLTTGTGQDAAGGAIADSVFFGALAVDMQATGLVYVPVGNYPAPLPGNSVVGWDHGVSTTGGYRDVIISNAGFTGDVTVGTKQAHFTYGGANDIVTGVPGVGDLGVNIAVPVSDQTFQPDSDLAVYPDVADYLDLTGIDSALWDDVHDGGGGNTAGVVAVLPSDKLVTSDIVDAAGDPNTTTGTGGFVALAGVFLEPTFPRPTKPLNQTVPHVVDSARSAAFPSEVGMRDGVSYGIGSTEALSFEVRRIRRFHSVLDRITENLAPLRFAYEIRRGVVDSGASDAFTLVAVVGADGATQLGDFDNPDVNVNPGDEARLIRGGVLVDTAEIGVVEDDGITLKLRDPGFENAPLPGDTFEIYLRQAPVPHEQSNEQLFDLVVDEVVHQTSPSYTTGDGGNVATTNELRDSTVTDFGALGIQDGDYVIVDPAGPLAGPTGPATVPEEGARPIGDASVPDRGPGAPFLAGVPSELDDNRGFYRVTAVATDNLAVTGESEFTGSDASPVVYGALGQEYAVMPTVSGPPGEGQQDLRATAAAGASSPDPNSYKGNNDSVQPFGYRVVRTSSLFSQDAVELVFFMRERLLSWMEELTAVTEKGKSGSYFIFQLDEHITDLGSPTDPLDGLGVPSNVFLESLGGDADTAPFANVSDCLSVLDRRYWVLDYNLDYETPLGVATPYASFSEDAPGVPPLVAGSGRPVLPDRIEDVLERADRLRQMRFAWIRFRTDQVFGTLQSVVRFDTELPRRIQEQEDLLLLQEGLDET